MSKSFGLLLRSLLVMFALTLSACGGGPPPKLYLLQLPAVETNDVDVSSISQLGISQVTVPGYANDARIASRSGSGVVEQLDRQRWAEEPEEAITRLLAKRLKARAEATVLIEPWPRDYEPQARIEVMFDTLLREPDGGAHIAGQIQLLSGDGRRLLQSVPFEYRIKSRTTDTTAFFSSVARGVDEIARDAIDAMLSVRRSS